MYLVEEFQVINGHMAILMYEYEDMADAQEKYHEILSVAVKSDTEEHGAVIFDRHMDTIMKQAYEHK